ncbi:hypothetical protein Tco_0127426 [Tanacetum coccineum]
MPILPSFEENKLEYEDEDKVEIKMMGTEMDKESLEHNLYENDITPIVCHIFSPTSNTPIKPKDSSIFRMKKITLMGIACRNFEDRIQFLYDPGDVVFVFDYRLYHLMRKSIGSSRRSIGTTGDKETLDFVLDCTVKDLCASCFGKFFDHTIMSDSEHSTVTYTSVSEDDSDIGSPELRACTGDARAGTTFTYLHTFVPEPVYPKFLPVDDESDPEEDPEEDDEEDPEEDPADYPADRGDRDDEESSDDDDDAEEEHLAPADPAAVAYSADQDPYIAYRVTARMSIRPQAPAPFLSEEVAERLDALTILHLHSPLSPYSSPLPQIPSPPLPISSPPPNGPTYVEGSLGSRAAGIRQRDALPSPIHETEMPEICLPLRKRPRRTTPGPGYEVGESSAAGTARQVRPATAGADLYGFTDMLDAAPGRQTTRELGYVLADNWDDIEDEIIYSQLDDATGMNEDSTWSPESTCCTGIGHSLTQLALMMDVGGPDYLRAAGHVTDPTTTTSVTSAQLQAMIDEGVTAVLAARATTRNGDDSHTSGTGVRRNERTVRECTYQDFMKCQPLFFRGTEGVVDLTQWFERMETVFRISNCTVKNQVMIATCTA